MTAPPAFPSTVTARLNAIACRGSFEAHLTVDAETPACRARFEALCAELAVKCVLIELALGEHRSQPMTASYHRGELAGVLAEIEQLHARLWSAGFPVVRVKLEAVATNVGVPDTDDEAAGFPDSYFEHHVKLRLPDDCDLESLRALCDAHGAHLSRNDRKRDARGLAERFVTSRAHAMGRARATTRFEALVHALATAGHDVIGTKTELAIYDGRIGLDAGWLDPPVPS